MILLLDYFKYIFVLRNVWANYASFEFVIRLNEGFLWVNSNCCLVHFLKPFLPFPNQRPNTKCFKTMLNT